MIRISQHAAKIPASPTLAIDARAKQLKAQGVDVIGFAAGEPDFPTPEPIRAAMQRALDEGRTTYTAVGGIPELKAAVRAEFEKRLDMRFQDEEIIASCGAKHSLYNLFLALLDPGDEVLVPAPFWVSYPVMVEMAGGRPVTVVGEASRGFLPTIEALEAAVTPKTRALILNNPSNPTGAFWSAEDLAPIAEWLRRHPQIVVVSDAIYDALVYDGRVYTELLSLAPDLRPRYVLVNGMSKAFAMTGLRLGYALAPAELVKAMTNLQSQSTSNPTSIVQWGGVEALRQGEAVIAPMRARFQARRDRIHGLLTAIPGVKMELPRGAFYAFPDVSAFHGRSHAGGTIRDDMDLASYLLDAARVAVVPGTPFAAPGFMRLSYATSESLIDAGVGRIAEALAALR